MPGTPTTRPASPGPTRPPISIAASAGACSPPRPSGWRRRCSWKPARRKPAPRSSPAGCRIIAASAFACSTACWWCAANRGGGSGWASASIWPTRCRRRWSCSRRRSSCRTTRRRPSPRSSWLFHIDARNLVATHWEPLEQEGRIAGFRVRLLETEGRPGRAPAARLPRHRLRAASRFPGPDARRVAARRRRRAARLHRPRMGRGRGDVGTDAEYGSVHSRMLGAPLAVSHPPRHHHVMIVTIDGPAGAGKSSAARAWRSGWASASSTPAPCTAPWPWPACAATSRSGRSAGAGRSGPLDLRFDYREGRLWLDGEDVSEAIRTQEVHRRDALRRQQPGRPRSPRRAAASGRRQRRPGDRRSRSGDRRLPRCRVQDLSHRQPAGARPPALAGDGSPRRANHAGGSADRSADRATSATAAATSARCCRPSMP